MATSCLSTTTQLANEYFPPLLSSLADCFTPMRFNAFKSRNEANEQNRSGRHIDYCVFIPDFFSHTKKTLHRAFLGSLVVGEEKRKNYCLCGSQNFQNRNYYSTSAHLDNEYVKKCIKKQHGVKCQLYYKWGGITKIEKKKKTQWMKRPWQEEILLTDGRWRKKWSEPTNEKQFRNIKSRNWSVFPSKSEKTVSPEDEKPCAEQFLWPGRPVKIQEFQANCWGHCYRRQQWAR